MSCKKYVHVHVQEKSLTLVTLNERSVNQYLRLAEQNWAYSNKYPPEEFLAELL